MLYGSIPYETLGYNAFIRAEFIIVACSWIYFIVQWMPNKKIIISDLGKNTMAIYLLHGFIVIATKNNLFFNYSLIQNIIIAIILTIIIIFAFGNKYIANLFNNIFCLDIILKSKAINQRKFIFKKDKNS